MRRISGVWRPRNDRRKFTTISQFATITRLMTLEARDCDRRMDPIWTVSACKRVRVAFSLVGIAEQQLFLLSTSINSAAPKVLAMTCYLHFCVFSGQTAVFDSAPEILFVFCLTETPELQPVRLAVRSLFLIARTPYMLLFANGPTSAAAAKLMLPPMAT